MQGAGYLAIWSDLAPEYETDWAHWMTREHAAERVGIGGFLACRIFRALGAAVNRYFILYELENEQVVGGADSAEQPVDHADMRALGRHERTRLREDGDQRVLAQEGRLAAHIGAGEQPDADLRRGERD